MLKQILLIIISLGLAAVLVVGLFVAWVNVYSEKVTVHNNSQEVVEIGIVTYCYECEPGEYREVHKNQIIKPDRKEKFNVWWDDEHFETPLFYRVLKDGSKIYYCATKKADQYALSDMESVTGVSLNQIAIQCKGTTRKPTSEIPQANDIPETDTIIQDTEKECDKNNPCLGDFFCVGNKCFPVIECSKNIDCWPGYICYKGNCSDDSELINKILFETKYTEEEICTMDPYITDIGSPLYLTFDKYRFGFFGQLFTADDCGGDRIEDMFGVENGVYYLGATMSLKNVPSEEFKKILLDVGFECNRKDQATCTSWRLDDYAVPVEEILRLKPFADQIQSIDCINCG
ncbi:hypothetical protein ACFLZY_01500 [Patescibacteria group bacterium]